MAGGILRTPPSVRIVSDRKKRGNVKVLAVTPLRQVDGNQNSAKNSHRTILSRLPERKDHVNYQDSSCSVQDLRDEVHQFVEERDWQQFHSPKNLAMSVAIEAAELMEHFQWLSIDQSRQLVQDPSRRQEIEEEMADVLCYLLALANQLEVDLSSAVVNKMVKNRAKYPAAEYRGRFGLRDVPTEE